MPNGLKFTIIVVPTCSWLSIDSIKPPVYRQTVGGKGWDLQQYSIQVCIN